MTQLTLTLKNAALKLRRDGSQDCVLPALVLSNLIKRVEFDKIPLWATFQIKNYVLNSLENVRNDWSNFNYFKVQAIKVVELLQLPQA